MTGTKSISIGQRFGRLVTVRRMPSIDRKPAKWICRCDCGNEHSVRPASLVTGEIQSCGCLNRELVAERFKKHGQAGIGKQTPEYRAWLSMRHRCRNPNYRDFDRYGGRGIKVCQRWDESFDNFLQDMGQRPSAAHSLDRFPNNNGDYEPSNCRWGTRTEQARNTRTVNVVIYDGEYTTLPALAERFGLSLPKVRRRINSGWSLERALS